MSSVSLEIQAPDILRLEKTFQDLAYSDQRNVLLSAFRKATKPTVDAVKANAPQGKHDNLRKSIGLLTAINEIAVILAARRKRPFKGDLGAIFEDGTKERQYKTKRGMIHRTGHIIGLKYFQKGIDTTQNKVLESLGDEWHKSIERFHRKHGLR